jgi:hypothetical protein
MSWRTTVHRLNWLRSLNIRDRWKEELTLVTSEMEWFVRYTWSRRADAMSWVHRHSAQSRDAYALRQADMWHRVGMDAASRFREMAGIAIAID